MEYLQKFLSWAKTKPKWAKVIILIIALLIMVVLLFTSCSASHYVAQSVSSYTKGDTTTTIIKYEQVGNIKKR